MQQSQGKKGQRHFSVDFLDWYLCSHLPSLPSPTEWIIIHRYSYRIKELGTDQLISLKSPESICPALCLQQVMIACIVTVPCCRSLLYLKDWLSEPCVTNFYASCFDTDLVGANPSGSGGWDIGIIPCRPRANNGWV